MVYKETVESYGDFHLHSLVRVVAVFLGQLVAASDLQGVVGFVEVAFHTGTDFLDGFAAVAYHLALDESVGTQVEERLCRGIVWSELAWYMLPRVVDYSVLLFRSKTYFGTIGFGIPDWLVDAEGDSGFAVVPAVVAIFVFAEVDTQVMAVKIYSQKEELPRLHAFFERVLKYSSARYGCQVEAVCSLTPLQWSPS